MAKISEDDFLKMVSWVMNKRHLDDIGTLCLIVCQNAGHGDDYALMERIQSRVNWILERN
ncbi:hypothetical protein AB6F95_004631 [Salmonella enterica]